MVLLLLRPVPLVRLVVGLLGRGPRGLGVGAVRVKILGGVGGLGLLLDVVATNGRLWWVQSGGVIISLGGWFIVVRNLDMRKSTRKLASFL